MNLHRRMNYLVLLLFTYMAAAAQSVPVAPGLVDGRIQNAITGETIAGASIIINCLGVNGAGPNCGNSSATSRSDGTFFFDAVSPGKYIVRGAAEGFVAMPGESIVMTEVEAGQQVSHLVIKLTPEGVIKGKVVDEAGNSMAGISVEALSIRHTNSGRVHIVQSAKSSTDKSGLYTLNRLSPGSYYIAATGSVRSFYPSALSADQANSITVEPGQSYEGMNIRIRPVSTYHIQGKVADFAALEEKLKSQFRLELGSDTQASLPGESVRIASDGSFDINGVLPGSYVLHLKTVGSSLESDASVQAMSMRQLAQQDVGVDGDVTGVVLSIPPPIKVSGRIVLPDSLPSEKLKETQISLRPVEATGSDYKNAKPQADGAFQFSPCDAVKYAVRVVAPSGLYVKSVEFNRQDALSHVLDLSSGTGGELVVTLGVGSAAISGTLEGGGQPQLPTCIFLIPANWNPEISGDLAPRPTKNGTFIFNNLAPGAYVLVALEWTDNNSYLWRTPEFVHALQGEGLAIELHPGDHLQETVPVVSDSDAKRIAGRVGANF